MSRLGERLRALVERVDALSERLTRVEQGLVEHRWEHAQHDSTVTTATCEQHRADELDLVRFSAEADQWRLECEAALERYEQMRDAYLLMAARAGRLQGQLLNLGSADGSRADAKDSSPRRGKPTDGGPDPDGSTGRLS